MSAARHVQMTVSTKDESVGARETTAAGWDELVNKLARCAIVTENDVRVIACQVQVAIRSKCQTVHVFINSLINWCYEESSGLARCWACFARQGVKSQYAVRSRCQEQVTVMK